MIESNRSPPLIETITEPVEDDVKSEILRLLSLLVGLLLFGV